MFERIWQWIFPQRASTHTWMTLTFALFVGAAVLSVAFYIIFILDGEIENAMHNSLRDEAVQVVERLEEAGSSADRREVLQDIAEHTDMHVAALGPETLAVTPRGTELLANPAFEEDLSAADDPSGILFFERVDERDRRILYAAVDPPGSPWAVRIAQHEPPLFATLERLQAVLVAGMILGLALALLGSWVAAHQVTTPLRAISNSARSISEGKFDKDIRVDSRATEFQDLADSLNRMSHSYREKIEELERLTQLQSEFIGNVSHEVRNPIFAVGGYLEALSTPSLTREMRKKYAEKGLLNLQRLNNLFNDLIEIAQLEYREDLIRSEVFDLQELIDEIEDMLAPKAQEKDLTLQLENPHLLVSADRNRIRQVLVNLIENAIAYTAEGAVRCRFRRRADKVRIEIIDTGKGIKEEHLERIFERFYRIDPDRSRRSGGTGLGLSIVKQILQAHGEQIHVESTSGRGTRFWFDLPYAGLAEEAAAQVA